MNEPILVDIIRLCIANHEKAATIYGHLSRAETQGELRIFWNRMSEEADAHASGWKRLLELTDGGAVGALFDHPYEIRQDLADIDLKTDRLLRQSQQPLTTMQGFLLAFYLEFYLLHPAFEILFDYLKSLKEKTPDQTYDAHLQRFLDAMMRYGQVTPELELLSETIQRLRKENRMLSAQTHIDPLTGVHNHRGLYQAIRTLAHLAQRTGTEVGVMLIDIDHFRSVNEIHGHRLADEVLERVARILRNRLRASDVIGRWGGEEFLVYLAHVKTEALPDVAESVRAAVEQGTQDEVPVTVSIGVCHGLLSEDVDATLEAMIRGADVACRDAKEQGRNCAITRPLGEAV